MVKTKGERPVTRPNVDGKERGAIQPGGKGSPRKRKSNRSGWVFVEVWEHTNQDQALDRKKRESTIYEKQANRRKNFAGRGGTALEGELLIG